MTNEEYKALEVINDTIENISLASCNLVVICSEIIDPGLSGPVVNDALYFITTSIEKLVEQLYEQFSDYFYKKKESK